MAASLVFFRLLAYLGVGGIGALAALDPRQAALGFFRFSAALYAVLGAVSVLVAPRLPLGAVAPLVAALGVAFAYAALAPRLGRRGGRAALAVAALAGAFALGVELWIAAAESGGTATYVALGAALASATLLGSVLTAMVLGHWYLVMPGAPVEPLLRLSWLYLGSLVLRAALLGLVAARLSGHALARALDDAGPFVWPRLLFGIVAPLVLALMVISTVRIRSTQSATGILYVACVLVLIGEGLAKYLEVRTRLAV